LWQTTATQSIGCDIFFAQNECSFASSTPEPSVVSNLLYSKRVLFRFFSTRNECSFASSPLDTSVVSHLLHPKRVWFRIFSLETSVVSHLLYSKRVWFRIFSTRNECGFASSPLETSVDLVSMVGSVYFIGF
jgi:hypothetical protein